MSDEIEGIVGRVEAFVSHLEGRPGSLAFGSGKTLKPSDLRALLSLQVELEELRADHAENFANKVVMSLEAFNELHERALAAEQALEEMRSAVANSAASVASDLTARAPSCQSELVERLHDYARLFSGKEQDWPFLADLLSKAAAALAQPEALTHPETPESADGWLPIDSAPKDGTLIQANHDDWTAPLLVSYQHGEWAPWVKRVTFGRPRYVPDPTHWRPPPPPAETDVQGSERSDDEGGLRDEPLQNPKPEGAS